MNLNFAEDAALDVEIIMSSSWRWCAEERPCSVSWPWLLWPHSRSASNVKQVLSHLLIIVCHRHLFNDINVLSWTSVLWRWSQVRNCESDPISLICGCVTRRLSADPEQRRRFRRRSAGTDRRRARRWRRRRGAHSVLNRQQSNKRVIIIICTSPKTKLLKVCSSFSSFIFHEKKNIFLRKQLELDHWNALWC